MAGSHYRIVRDMLAEGLEAGVEHRQGKSTDFLLRISLSGFLQVPVEYPRPVYGPHRGSRRQPTPAASRGLAAQRDRMRQAAAQRRRPPTALRPAARLPSGRTPCTRRLAIYGMRLDTQLDPRVCGRVGSMTRCDSGRLTALWRGPGGYAEVGGVGLFSGGAAICRWWRLPCG